MDSQRSGKEAQDSKGAQPPKEEKVPEIVPLEPAQRFQGGRRFVQEYLDRLSDSLSGRRY